MTDGGFEPVQENGGPGPGVAGAVRITPFRRRHLRSVVRIEE